MPPEDESEELEELPPRHETLAHLVPRVVVRAPFYSKELGPVRDVVVRDGCVVVLFEAGVELQFHGDPDLWKTLLRKVHAGELVVAGDVEDGAWNALGEAVTQWRTAQ
jgi:hypothetical protein